MKKIIILIMMGLSFFAFSQQKRTVPQNKKVIRGDSVNKFKNSYFDNCKCKVVITGNKVEGIVYDCNTTPFETRIIVTDIVSGQVWQKTTAFHSVPTIFNLPHGRSYHASVKSRFGRLNPIWTSECGTDFTLPNDVIGSVNLQNGKDIFCEDESIIVNTSVSNEVEHEWRFYKNSILIKTLPVGNALSPIEDLQYLYNDWQVGYYFPPGNYRVELLASNSASSKVFTVNFEVKNPTGVKPEVEIISKQEITETHPMGNVAVSISCNNKNNDGPILKITRNQNLPRCNFIDENITISIQKLDLISGNHDNPILRTIPTNGLTILKLKDYFSNVNFVSGDYYLIANKVVKIESYNTGDCALIISNGALKKRTRQTRASN